MKFDVVVFLITTACSVYADGGHHHHHDHHSSSGGGGYGGEQQQEQPVQVIIQKAGPSQVFGWLGNGHEEHAHPRRPPIRPQYIFSGRPDFVLSYNADVRGSGGAGGGHQQLSVAQQPSSHAPHDAHHGHHQHHASSGQLY
jgi:hypothetical protein